MEEREGRWEVYLRWPVSVVNRTDRLAEERGMSRNALMELIARNVSEEDLDRWEQKETEEVANV